MKDGIDPEIKRKEVENMRDDLQHIMKLLDEIDFDRTDLQAITICSKHLYSVRCTIDKYIFTAAQSEKEEIGEAEIHFAPICSKCGTVLYDKEVDVKDEELHFYTWEEPYLPIRKKQITPDMCPSCGAMFKCIRMQTKLPYTYSHKNPLL